MYFCLHFIHFSLQILKRFVNKLYLFKIINSVLPASLFLMSLIIIISKYILTISLACVNGIILFTVTVCIFYPALNTPWVNNVKSSFAVPHNLVLPEHESQHQKFVYSLDSSCICLSPRMFLFIYICLLCFMLYMCTEFKEKVLNAWFWLNLQWKESTEGNEWKQLCLSFPGTWAAGWL